jgi:hypothetical protein
MMAVAVNGFATEGELEHAVRAHGRIGLEVGHAIYLLRDLALVDYGKGQAWDAASCISCATYVSSSSAASASAACACEMMSRRNRDILLRAMSLRPFTVSSYGPAQRTSPVVVVATPLQRRTKLKALRFRNPCVRSRTCALRVFY